MEYVMFGNLMDYVVFGNRINELYDRVSFMRHGRLDLWSRPCIWRSQCDWQLLLLSHSLYSWHAKRLRDLAQNCVEFSKVARLTQNCFDISPVHSARSRTLACWRALLRRRLQSWAGLVQRCVCVTWFHSPIAIWLSSCISNSVGDPRFLRNMVLLPTLREPL